MTPAIGTAAASDRHHRQRRRDLDLDRGRCASVDEAAGTITFTVTRTGDAEGTQSVDYALTGDVEAGDISAAPVTGT